jgi:HD-like signal output (HDOD) protein
MQLSDEKRHVQDVPDVFKGLTEKDLVIVYNLGKIRKLNPGEVFIRAGDIDQTAYVILAGSVKIEKSIDGRLMEIAVLEKNGCVGEVAFVKDARRTATAVATEATTVMVMDEQGLNALPPSIKSVIFRNLGELAGKRIIELDAMVTELSKRNNYLVSYMKDIRIGNSALYENAEMIRHLIKSFPRLPMYVTKLTELLLDENASASEIITYAKTDPSLVGTVLKTANSPFYNLPGKVGDFQHAVLLLGFNQIYQIIMDNGIKNIMPREPEFLQLQFHSLIISVLGFEIAKLCGMKKPLIANTLGILHGIGESIILLLKKDYHGMGILLDLMDDAKLGALILREWNLPESICLGIEYHYYPEFAPPEEVPATCRDMAAILYLAHLCFDCLEGKDEKATRSTYLPDYMRLLHLCDETDNRVSSLLARIISSLQKKIEFMPEVVRNFLCKNGRIKPAGTGVEVGTQAALRSKSG